MYLQVQCNVFEGGSGEIALTAAGGLRQIPGITETFENAALVTLYSIHYHFDIFHNYISLASCNIKFSSEINGGARVNGIDEYRECVAKLIVVLLSKSHSVQVKYSL